MSENEQILDLNYAVYLRIQEVMSILDIKSISKLAEMSGVNKSTISTLKTKKDKTVTFCRQFVWICKAVGMTLAEFFDSPAVSK